MKQIKLGNNKSNKTTLIVGTILLVVLVSIIAGYNTTKAVNNFFTDNYLQFNRVIQIVLNKPIEIKKREPIVKTIILDYPDEIDTPLEKYICERFGTYDCKTALAIAKAESGLKEDAYHYNTNDTIDIGIFQVNETHWNKEGCSPDELFVAESNVDCAFQIWEASGWNPWVAYQKGSFLNHVE